MYTHIFGSTYHLATYLETKSLGSGVQYKISRRWLKTWGSQFTSAPDGFNDINDLSDRANDLSPLSSPAYTVAPHLSQMNVFISNVLREGDSQVNTHTKERLHCFQSTAMRCVSTHEITEGILKSSGGKKWSKRFVISVTVQNKACPPS